MGNHRKAFLFAVIALLLLVTSPLHATDSVNFSWTKALSEPAVAIDWSPDGDFIVFANPDAREIALLNWHTGKFVWRTLLPASLRFGSHSFLLRWSPDNNFIAATISGDLYRIDAQTGELHLLKTGNISSTEITGYLHPRWSPDSTSIAVLNAEGFIDIFSATTGEMIQTIDLQGEYHVVGYSYSGFDWSPDGQIFATPRPVNGAPDEAEAQRPVQVGFWDRAGNLLTDYTQATPNDPVPQTLCLAHYTDGLLADYDTVEWANDSRTLAVAGIWGYGICRLNIDGTTDDSPISLQGITTLRWSSDQRWLVGALVTSPTIWVTDAANNDQTVELKPTGNYLDQSTEDAEKNDQTWMRGGIRTLAWSPDSQYLAAGTDFGLWIGTLQPPAR